MLVGMLAKLCLWRRQETRPDAALRQLSPHVAPAPLHRRSRKGSRQECATRTSPARPSDLDWLRSSTAICHNSLSALLALPDRVSINHRPPWSSQPVAGRRGAEEWTARPTLCSERQWRAGQDGGGAWRLLRAPWPMLLMLFNNRVTRRVGTIT